MSSTPQDRPFHVLVIAKERQLLRRLSRFLQVFGYRVFQAAEASQAERALSGQQIDFVLTDSETIDKNQLRSLRHPVEAAEARNRTFFFWLAEDGNEGVLSEALEAGIDDFLAKPVVYGELLSRLRAAARSVEFERRAAQQRAVDPLTKMLGRGAFTQRVRMDMNHASGRLFACVTLDIDLLCCINERYGRPAGDHAIQCVADLLARHRSECKYLAHLGGGRFAVWLAETTDAVAFAWSEKLRAAIAHMEITHGDDAFGLTVSCGVAASAAGAVEPDAVLLESRRALECAKTSGRNYVVRSGQFDSETREWENLATQGQLFADTTARDVLTPSSLVLCSDESVSQAAKLMRQCDLREVPVVNHQGRLVGLVSTDHLSPLPDEQQGQVRDVMSVDPPTFHDHDPFDDLMEFFTEDPNASLVVVVKDGRPLGIVYRRVLAGLSEPLTTETFASDDERDFASSSYLLVPELT